jgi:hypothetical protein
MNESLMYGFEDEYNAVTLMLSLTKETACAADLPGVGENQNQSRQVAQPRKGITRKSSK